MKLIYRIGFYLAGFSIGIIFLTFIFKGKKTEFNYFPNARTLKNINSKKIVYSQNVLDIMKAKSMDTLAISTILMNGDVNFSKSKTKLEPCKLYVIEGVFKGKEVTLSVLNCEKIATIKSISLE